MIIYGAELWSLRKREAKYIKSFLLWLWRRLEGIMDTKKNKNKKIG